MELEIVASFSGPAARPPIRDEVVTPLVFTVSFHRKKANDLNKNNVLNPSALGRRDFVDRLQRRRDFVANRRTCRPAAKPESSRAGLDDDLAA